MATQKLKIVVTGANGQLGQCLRELAPTVPHTFIFTDIGELDITSRAAVAAFLKEHRPEWVVNCAAYTAVDKAESEESLARVLNVDAVGILAEETRKAGAGLLHISTDYVYGGDNPTPRQEDDPTAPLSVYGRTKLEGEKMAAKNPEYMIIRTSWLYSIYGSNFVKTMRNLGSQQSEIGVVADQWGSPTSAHDLAKAIVVALEKPKRGIYNFSNEGATSWALFAEEIFTLSGIDCTVNHITTEQYPTPAQRPEYSLMDKGKFSRTFGVIVPEWEHSLEEVVSRL